MQDRVCFFSMNDLLIGHYLKMAETRIKEVSAGNVPNDLEGIIELWHVKQLFENNCKLINRSDAEFENLKSATKGYNAIIAKFFRNINPQIVKNEFEQLEWTYKKTFWEIIDAYKLFNLIEPDTLREIISENINYLREVLECKGIVEKFKDVIREELLNNVNSAHIILDKYAAKNEFNKEHNLFLPSNLTLNDKEQIIVNYLQSENPNVNYVRLITQLKDIKGQIEISSKTRLAAEKLAKKLNEELLRDPRTVTTNYSVAIQFLDEEGIEFKGIKYNEKEVLTLTYSIPYIRKCNNIKCVKNCNYLFEWFNQHTLLNLINKRTEVDVMETVFIDKGRDSYPSYMAFERKNDLSLYQLFGYNDVLKKEGSSFEKELILFYEHHLKEEFDYPGLHINFPNQDDSTLNKCRVLCPELDAVVKQYDTFVKEDEIDPDLIRLSKPLKVEDGKSLLVNKYYEVAEGNDEIQRVLWHLLGSGNALLAHVDPFKDKKYRSLAELLENESNVQYANYENFQKPHLDFLIQQGVIGVNDNGIIYIANPSMLNVLKSLWEYEVCSYWHYNEDERAILDNMFKKGWLKKDDHLLSRPERDYFSYYLDNSKFTNGFAYRNHYMHGSISSVNDEQKHTIAYMIFLRLFAILLLKIDDDLRLARRAIAISVKSNA